MVEAHNVNICVVNTLFPPHVSGTARGAFLLSNKLAEAGHAVTVITSRIEGASAIDNSSGLNVHRLRSIRYPKLQILHNADLYTNLVPGNLSEIIGILARNEVDVVQTYGQFFDLTFLSVLAAKLLRKPVVLTIGTRMEHTVRLYDVLFRFVDETLIRHLVARRVDRIVAMDRLMRDYMIRRYGASEPVIRFIPAGVDIERFAEPKAEFVRKMYGIRNTDPIILSVGTISNLRGARSLIQAMPRVLKQFPNAKLLFVGSMYSSEPVQLANKLGLEGSVVFCGRVDYDMIPSYFAACDVEGHDLDSGLGIGLASLEAMAAGKAVLSSASEDNFMDLRLSNWNNIVLVRPGNTGDISDALLRLLSDRALREGIGKNSQSLVREHFSLGSVCRKYEALYNEVAKT